MTTTCISPLASYRSQKEAELPSCVHIIKNAQPECTGIARIVADLADRSSFYGYQASILFLGDGPLVASIKNLGIYAAAIPWTGGPDDLAGAWRVWRWIRKHPAEVAHLHRGAGFLRMLCHLAGIKAVVQHVHGPALDPNSNSVSELRFPRADAVIACSKAVADALRGCSPQVVYAGIEIQSDPPPGPSLSGTLRLGVLSRLVPLKSVDTVIEATARLTQMGIDVQTEIAGSGPSESSLRDLAETLGVADRVHFLGWQDDVASLLSSWHLLIMPSLHEGLPVAALEAMRAARAVFASRVGGLPELVVDNVTGRLFVPRDTGSLVRCIAQVEKNRPDLSRMGREGWERARALFSAEDMSRHTTALYDRLLHISPHTS